MRITKLTLAGFGPYKNQQVVDFARFDEAGLFLITGKTGAGKSSILDAICFALYGSVPRYDGTQAQLRSDHCEVDDPTYVELEFTVGGVAYSVHRTPEYLRAKKSGTGTTKQAHDASLSRAGEVIAAKPVDVAHELADIVALTKDQFLQVVLLAQNRFQQFLLARNDDRQAVLRTLFGSQRFLSLETALDDRRKLLQTELAEADAVLRQHAVEAARLLELDEVPAVTDAAWFESGYASLAGERSFAKVISGSADVAFTAADIDYQGVLAVVALQERRGVALETIADLEGSAVTVAGHRAVVAAARRAAPVWPLIGELDKATAALESAAARHEAARAAFGSDADPLAEVDALTATIGALADVLADEKQLPSVAADVDRLAVALDLDETALAASVERRDALPAEIDAVGVQITETAVRAARVTEATEQVARVREARDSEQSALDLDVRLELARVAEKETSAAHTAAGAALDALYERRLGGFAAELATTLTPGEPCAVCGSLEHPAPASHDGTPVTADDIEAARQTVAERRSAMDVAHDLAGTIAASLAEARGRTQGKTLDELDAELRTAQESLTAATDAARELAEREADRDRLRAELASADDRVAALRSGRDATVKLLTEATSRRDGISARVDASRGDAESVTARVRQLSDRLTVARAAVDAAATAVTRAEAQARAEAALAAQLRENDFADVEEARSARRPASEIATLEAEIRRHDEARATASATLAEPGIADAPEAPVDAEPARLARVAALAARDDARAAQAALSERVDRLGDLVDEAAVYRESTRTRRLEFEQLRELASVVRGDEPNTRRMRLETFVLAAQLEEIVAAANTRLRTMSAGRYSLEHDDALQYRNTKSGLGLAIRDEHTGRTRPTHSLSGGETFLASLALALGLAEVVTNQTGGITLDTLFIDEGFGSLDSETLDIAMSTLDGLREGGRTIGLISHVEAMKEQIPAKLRITVSPRGDSSVEESFELA